LPQKPLTYDAEFWTLVGTELKVKKVTFEMSDKYDSRYFYVTNHKKSSKIEDPLKYALQKISEKQKGKNLACVYGEPGTGKTTLIQNIAAGLTSVKGWKVVHLSARTVASKEFETRFVDLVATANNSKYLFVVDDSDPTMSCSAYDYFTEGIFSNLPSDFLFLVTVPKHVYYLPRPGRALFRLTLGRLPATVAASLMGNNEIRKESTVAKLFNDEED